MALKGQTITIFENSPKWSKIIKNGLDIKIAHFDPGSHGICPAGCLIQIFWENRDLWYFWPIFGKCVYIYLTRQGTRHKAQATWHKAQGTSHMSQGTRHKPLGTMHKAQGTSHMAQGTRHKAHLLPRHTCCLGTPATTPEYQKEMILSRPILKPWCMYVSPR